jgi:hypothetical protein
MSTNRTVTIQGRTFTLAPADIPADGDCAVILGDVDVTYAAALRIQHELEQVPAQTAADEFERIHARRFAARGRLVGRR